MRLNQSVTGTHYGRDTLNRHTAPLPLRNRHWRDSQRLSEGPTSASRFNGFIKGCLAHKHLTMLAIAKCTLSLFNRNVYPRKLDVYE